MCEGERPNADQSAVATRHAGSEIGQEELQKWREKIPLGNVYSRIQSGVRGGGHCMHKK